MKAKIKKLPVVFGPFLEEVSKTARSMKVRVYLVGGVVRDLLVRRSTYDLDLTVEGDAIALAHRLATKLKLKYKRHRPFGTATIFLGDHKVDFATARRERYLHQGALPSVSGAGLKEDLLRRDFTINAMAVSLNKDDYGTLIDYCQGRQDLRRGLVRVMHDESFLDDPTRILRAIRFEQRFNFSIERRTLSLLKEATAKKALTLINEQRIKDELVLILKEPAPYRYIRRIDSLMGFYFIDDKFRLGKRGLLVIRNIEKAIDFFKKNFKKRRKLEYWLVYLVGVAQGLSETKVASFSRSFCLRKGQRKVLQSALRAKKTIIKKLQKKRIQEDTIYKVLNPLSFEAILFLFAYSKDIIVKEHIAKFFSRLCEVRLHINGTVLQEKKFEPSVLYNQMLERLLHRKIRKKFTTKEEELREVEKIFKHLKKN